MLTPFGEAWWPSQGQSVLVLSAEPTDWLMCALGLWPFAALLLLLRNVLKSLHGPRRAAIRTLALSRSMLAVGVFGGISAEPWGQGDDA